MKKLTIRVTKWFVDIPVEANCSACPSVVFKAIGSTHRPNREEFQKSLQSCRVMPGIYTGNQSHQMPQSKIVLIPVAGNEELAVVLRIDLSIRTNREWGVSRADG
jgi:hypothetical protein